MIYFLICDLGSENGLLVNNQFSSFATTVATSSADNKDERMTENSMPTADHDQVATSAPLSDVSAVEVERTIEISNTNPELASLMEPEEMLAHDGGNHTCAQGE